MGRWGGAIVIARSPRVSVSVRVRLCTARTGAGRARGGGGVERGPACVRRRNRLAGLRRGGAARAVFDRPPRPPRTRGCEGRQAGARRHRGASRVEEGACPPRRPIPLERVGGSHGFHPRRPTARSVVCSPRTPWGLSPLANTSPFLRPPHHPPSAWPPRSSAPAASRPPPRRRRPRPKTSSCWAAPASSASTWRATWWPRATTSPC